MAKKTFAEMTDDEKAQLIRPLMKEGHTNTTAAAVLGTTPGAIAGVRFRKKIPARPKKPKQKQKEQRLRPPVLKKVEQPTIAPLPPAPPPEPSGKPPPPYKLASMRHLACDDRWEDGTLCEYVHEEGSRYCVLHNWMHKHPRT